MHITRTHVLHYLNTPPQMDTRPISLVCFWCFCRCSAFINTSVVCSGSRMLSTVTTPSHTSLQIQCHQRSICFKHLWYWGFLAIDREPSLSPFITVGKSSLSKPSSEYRFLSQHTLRAAFMRATYCIQLPLMTMHGTLGSWNSTLLLLLQLRKHNLLLTCTHLRS